MTRKVLLISMVILLGLAAVAQEFPRAEMGLMYSYARFSPSSHYSPNMNLNGGGGALTINFHRYFGVKAELMGYGGSKATWTLPVGNTLAPNGATVTASGNLFTYLFGPQVRIPTPKVNPYLHFLFGGAHTSVFGNAVNALQTASAAPSGNAFAMAIGGGLDVPVTHKVAIRVGQFDYLMTRFNNEITGPDNQHNFRYSAGVVFRFGNP